MNSGVRRSVQLSTIESQNRSDDIKPEFLGQRRNQIISQIKS